MNGFTRYAKQILLPLTLFIGTFCKGQNPNTGIEVAKMQFMSKQVIPPSPDAAELGKYGNVPVSLFTGTPSVSVPLTELKGHVLSLSMSLSYNASGFKPEDAASWVGTSWALNAGGVITRAVRGNPDTEANYFGVANVLNPPSDLDIIPFYNYVRDLGDGTKETQPDVYYYNFGGHSGKFTIRPDMIVVKQEKDLKTITPCITANCNGSSFTIVDEQGVTYVFNQVETTSMVPNDDAGQPSYNTYTFVSAWYLSLMYSADGHDVIEFEYHTTANAQVLYQNMIPNRSVSYTYGSKRGPVCSPTTVSDVSSAMNIPPTVSIKKKFLKKIVLKKGNTQVAYIDIISGVGSSERQDSDFDEDRNVNEVKLYSTVNGTDRLIKQYHFSYSYFGNADATGSLAYMEKRLRLDNVQEISTDINTASPPAYIFAYNSGWSPRFTSSLDHWGFYNSANNTSLVPHLSFPGSMQPGHYFLPRNIGDGADREPYLGGSSAMLLNKIQYPTGGYTTFEYELNRAKFDDNTIHDVGGVRIKKIIDYSFSDKQATAKNYSYTLDDGTTSGKAGLFPVYASYSTFHHFSTPAGSGCPFMTQQECCDAVLNEASDYNLYTISISSNSIFGLGSFQGSHIGYSQVTESQVDLATFETLGKTVYKYEVGQYSEYGDDIRSGDLIEQSTYRNDGKLLQESSSIYQYQHILTNDIQARILKGSEVQTNKPRYCKIGTNDYYNYGDWQSPSASCIPGQIANCPTKFFLNSYTIFTQNKQLVQHVQKIYDQVSNSYLTTTKNLTYGNSNHNYPTAIDETTNNGEKIVTTIKYAVDYDVTTTSTEFANNIKYLVQKNITGTPIEKLQYRLYPDNTKKYLNGQLTNYSLNFPVGIYFLESNPPLTAITPSTILSGNLVYDSHYRLAGTFTYGHLNYLEQQSKTNDVTKSYLWDYDFQYPVAEAVGINHQIYYTSFETEYTGNLIFSGTPQTESTSPTGKRCYSLASGSISATIDVNTAHTVSYWRNSANSFSVTGSTDVKQGQPHNGWTYFEHTVSGTGTAIISGSGLIDEVRVYPKTSLMTTSTYDPLIGISSQCDANNRVTYYEYDGLNRLKNVKDNDLNIVKNFRYNHGSNTAPASSAQTLFYNAAIQQDFTKAGCTLGRYGDIVTYYIPFGKYAFTSQLGANAKAQADMTANGQQNANSIGLCRWYNAVRTQLIIRNNCLSEQGQGTAVSYTIPFGTYRSLISQADAEAMADADIATAGQAYANANAPCACGGEGQKFINGDCTSGTRINRNSELQANGQWKCTYYYIFLDGTVSPLYFSYSSDSNACPVNQ